jgi:hypothetical protein
MAKPQKITLRLPKKQTVELTVAQAADVMSQLLDLFGPPPPTLVPVFIGVPAPVLDHGAVPQPTATATGDGNCRCPVCTAFAGRN